MNLTTINTTRDEARDALAEWAATKNPTAEDDAIAAGYRAIAAGKRLIMLGPTIAAGGEDDLHRPRLAVAPTSAQTIHLERGRSGTVRFCTSEQPRDDWPRDVGSYGVRVPDALPPIDSNLTWTNHLIPARWRSHWRAMVPVVPPRFRVRGWRSAHVLFEAEWSLHTPPAPVDPALIRHLRGDLWVVHGVWDLTELERAVLLERNATPRP